jgi:hypothetical protein
MGIFHNHDPIFFYHKSSKSSTDNAFGGVVTPSDSCSLAWNSVQNGQGIAELCNYSGLGGGDAFNFFRMPGNPTSSPTLSHRVARIDISGAYIQTSDKRLKSNISEAPGLEALLKIKPLRYTHWASNGFDEEKKQIKIGKFFTQKIGFLAQDVQKSLPEAVSTPSSEQELYGIDYNCILACAVQSIQELHEKLQQQKQQITELQAQLPQAIP